MVLQRRRRCPPTMMNPVVAIVAMAMIAYPVVAQTGVTISAVNCPNDPTDLQGYTSLAALNNDMQLELQRIAIGGAPAPPYTFTLCPNQVFDATLVTLQPVLSDATFVCGANGDPEDDCTLLGGEEQVRIEDSTVDGYPLENLVFVGLSFADFSNSDEMLGSSIAALASSTTTATFMNNRWSAFESDFVVRQANDVGTPMNVQITGGTVQNGMSGAIFDNDGGFLTVTNLEVSDIMTVSLIATANGGVSFLQDSNIMSSTLDQVTFTTAQGAQSVQNTVISAMLGLRDVFYVEDIGSSLTVQGTAIRDNDITANSWAGVTILNGATAQISNSEITGNSGVEFGAAAGGVGSILTFSNSIISGNTGVADLNITSASILGITDAQVTVDRVQINENVGFTGHILVLFRSFLTIEESCVQGGSGDFVIFVDNESDFAATTNFISLETEATFRCPAGGPRLFKEGVNSGCFVGGACNGECLVAAEEETCLLLDSPTGAPTSMPTGDPNAPTVSPTTGAPSVSNAPSSSPVINAPTSAPTVSPTSQPPTSSPTTSNPTRNPTTAPTTRPTIAPTASPTVSISPTISPAPTSTPTPAPTEVPRTNAPVANNTPRPTFFVKKGSAKKAKGGKKGSKKGGKKGKSNKGGKGHGKGMKGSKGGKGMGGKGKRGRNLSESHPRQLLSASQQSQEPAWR